MPVALIVSAAIAIIATMVALLLIVVVGVPSGLLLPRHLYLFGYGVISVLYVELADLLPLVLLAADEHAVEVRNLPQALLHHLPLPEHQLELLEEILVLLPILLVVLQEIHCLLDLHPEFREGLLEAVELDQPLVCVLNAPVLPLRTDRILQVDAVFIAIGSAEVGVLELDREVFVAVHLAPVLQLPPLLLHLLEDGIAIRDGGDEDSPDEQVREDGCESISEGFLGAEHVVEAELGGDDVVVGVLNVIVEGLVGEILREGEEAIGLVVVPPPLLVAANALLAEIHSHHILQPRQFPLGNILPPAAADIQDMQYLALRSYFQVEFLLD